MLSDEDIRAGLKELLSGIHDFPHSIQKAKAFEYVLDNAIIDINESDYFVGFYNWGQLNRSIHRKYLGIRSYEKAFA